MALLQRGCCCCELRTCVRIQAWLGLLWSVLNIALGVLVLAIMADLVPPEHLPEQLRFKDLQEFQGRKKHHAAAENRTRKIEMAIGGGITLIVGLINLSISIALIYGCKKENRRLVLPALIWFTLSFLFMIVAFIVAIIATPVKIAAIVALAAVPMLALSIYVGLHLLSYYLELREEDKELKRQTL